MQGLLEKSNILDYSFEAQKITAKVNRAVDRAERYSRITGTPINLEKVRTKVRNHWEANNRKTIVKNLLIALNSDTIEERRLIWSETKFLANKFNLTIKFSVLRKMVALWHYKTRELNAA